MPWSPSPDPHTVFLLEWWSESSNVGLHNQWPSQSSCPNLESIHQRLHLWADTSSFHPEWRNTACPTWLSQGLFCCKNICIYTISRFKKNSTGTYLPNSFQQACLIVFSARIFKSIFCHGYITDYSFYILLGVGFYNAASLVSQVSLSEMSRSVTCLYSY